MFGRHRRELSCILPTRRVWLCWNWLSPAQKPSRSRKLLPDSAQISYEEHNTDRSDCGDPGRMPRAGGPRETTQTKVLMLQQRVSVAPDGASNFRAAAGERTGRDYRLGWGGERKEGRSQETLSLCIDLVGGICSS